MKRPDVLTRLPCFHSSSHKPQIAHLCLRTEEASMQYSALTNGGAGAVLNHCTAVFALTLFFLFCFVFLQRQQHSIKSLAIVRLLTETQVCDSGHAPSSVIALLHRETMQARQQGATPVALDRRSYVTEGAARAQTRQRHLHSERRFSFFLSLFFSISLSPSPPI